MGLHGSAGWRVINVLLAVPCVEPGSGDAFGRGSLVKVAVGIEMVTCFLIAPVGERREQAVGPMVELEGSRGLQIPPRIDFVVEQAGIGIVNPLRGAVGGVGQMGQAARIVISVAGGAPGGGGDSVNPAKRIVMVQRAMEDAVLAVDRLAGGGFADETALPDVLDECPVRVFLTVQAVKSVVFVVRVVVADG